MSNEQARAEWPGTQYQEAQLNTKPMGNCLLEANKVINGERQDEYGNPENSFQIIAEYWTTFLKHKYGLSTTLTPLDITNMMVLFKQARKIGQKHKRDNYVDSCGYEAIGADRLSEE